MVRDDRITEAGEGNWVFVPRSCLPSTLPENAEERLPPPPAVTTDGASGVTTTSATLNATVNPNGVDTKYFFEYGTTEGYGSYTTTEDAGSGTSPIPVSATIGSLAPGTTYYFRIVASSAIGEVFGGPVGFTTEALPPEATTSVASEVQQTQAKLNGTVNPKGTDTHYYFQYGTTTGYGSSTASTDAGSGMSSVPASATVTGLEPGVTYHYRIVASSRGGTSYGGDRTVTIPAPMVAFQANTGELFTYSATAGVVNTTEGMWPGTNPSIAGLATGGYVTAFNANTGELFTDSTTSGVLNTTEGLKTGTSPSITR